MRPLGYTLLILGIADAAVVPVLADRGPFFVLRGLCVALMLIMTGWRLRAPRPGSQRSAGSVDGTIEVPATPATSAFLARAASKMSRVYLYVVGTVLLLFNGIVVVAGWREMANDPRLFFYVFGGICAALVLIFGTFWAVTARSIRRDMREYAYLRTAGPVRVEPISGGFIVRLVDRSFTTGTSPAIKALGKLDWASIDHSRRAHVIFEIRNRSGEVVYRAEGL